MHADSRFQPPLRLQTKERIRMLAIHAPAGKEPRQQFAAQLLRLLTQRSLMRTGAKTDLLSPRKRVRRSALPSPRKLQAMQQQSYFSRGTGSPLNTRSPMLGH